jgi:hypothetical protein
MAITSFGLWNIRISMMSIKDSAYHRNPQPKGIHLLGDAQNITLNAAITGVMRLGKALTGEAQLYDGQKY